MQNADRLVPEQDGTGATHDDDHCREIDQEETCPPSTIARL
jgi:hypothetical protein